MLTEINKSKAPWYQNLKGAIFWAIIVTIVIIVLGLTVFISKSAWQLSANEIGDFFAGFAGALSFVWIIATIFLQKEELELQREEVKRLADETALQSNSLLVAARSDFQNRWANAVDSFVSQCSRKLARINREIANELCKKPVVYQRICDQLAARDRLHEFISVENLSFERYYLRSWNDGLAEIEISASFVEDKIDERGRRCTEEVIHFEFFSSFDVCFRLNDERISFDEISALVEEGAKLGFLSILSNYPTLPYAKVTSKMREISVMKCLIGELVEKSLRPKVDMID